MELVAVTNLIQLLEDNYGSSSLDAVTSQLLTKASKELQQYIAKADSGFKLLEDFLNAVQTLVKHDSSCFQLLSASGLLGLLKGVCQEVLKRLKRDGSSEELQVILEILLETANVLGDLHVSAKSQTCKVLCPHILDFLQADKLEFQVKMEVLKSTNMLLDQCPSATKEAVIQNEDFENRLAYLVSLIKSIGDYEFQVGLVECLIRLFPRKSRQKFSSQFIADANMLEGFLAIKDREFETDCRVFLNNLNSRTGSNNGVYSIPCVAAFVGNKQLQKPSDSGYDQFWVDFNIGSQRLTIFCEQDSLLSQGTQVDEQLWETVAIYKSDILKCSCCEIQGSIILEIKLKQRVCELYPSQHQDVTDNTVRVEFELDQEADIAEAVGKTFSFSEIRNKVSTVVNPIQISVREVQELDSQLQIQENEDPAMSYRTNMLPPASQESTVRRRKVSVPSVPMRTPLSTPVLPAEKILPAVSDVCETASKKLADHVQKGTEEKIEQAVTEPESIPDSIPFMEGGDFDVCEEKSGLKYSISCDESSVSDGKPSRSKGCTNMPVVAVKKTKTDLGKELNSEKSQRLKKENKRNEKGQKVCPSRISEKRTEKNICKNLGNSKSTTKQCSFSEDLKGKQNQTQKTFEDSEDKFDFDSQQDKIPDSLEPTVEPKVNSKAHGPEKIQRESRITEKYSKLLETKSSKKKKPSLKMKGASEDKTAKSSDSTNSHKHTDSVSKTHVSFKDFTPSLDEFRTTDHSNVKNLKQDSQAKLLSKEKKTNNTVINSKSTSKKLDKTSKAKSKTSDSSTNSAAHTKVETGLDSKRQLRCRDKNKNYKEIDSLNTSFIEESPVDKKDNAGKSNTTGVDNDILNSKELLEKKRRNRDYKNMDKKNLGHILSNVNKDAIEKYKVQNSEVIKEQREVEDHFVIKDKEFEIGLNENMHEKPSGEINFAKSDDSSDISEDYRFNDSQMSLKSDKRTESQPQAEILKTDYMNSWDVTASVQVGSSVKDRKKTKDQFHDKMASGRVKKQTTACKTEEILNKFMESVGKICEETDPDSSFKQDVCSRQTKGKKKMKTQTKSNADNLKVSGATEMALDYCPTDSLKQDEKNESANNGKKKTGKISKHNYTKVEQKRERMAFEDFDGDSHLKQCQVNSVPKTKGKGYVFQMSYSKSETNYKYRSKLTSRAVRSNSSEGYDPYDFAACENESVISATESPHMSVEHEKYKKPHNFVKHSRKIKNNTNYDSRNENSKFRNTKEFDSKYSSGPVSQDSLDMSPTSVKTNVKLKQELEKQNNKAISRKHLEEAAYNTGKTAFADSPVICLSDDNIERIQTKSREQKKISNKAKQKEKSGKRVTEKKAEDETNESDMDLDKSIVSPDLAKSQKHMVKKTLEKCKQKSHPETHKDLVESARALNNEDSSESSMSKYCISETMADSYNIERKAEQMPKRAFTGSVVDLESDIILLDTPEKSKSKTLLEQDPVTKKWYRKGDSSNRLKCDAVNGDKGHSYSIHCVEKKGVISAKRLGDEIKQKSDPYDEAERSAETAEEVAMDSDEISNYEENAFNKIVQDIVAARSGKKAKARKKSSGNKNLPTKVAEITEEVKHSRSSSFKEFDSEIVDCIMEKQMKTPCISASLASTPKVGSARHKHYNPLNISVIKTPVSVCKSVTFDTDVADREHEDVSSMEEETNRKKHRIRRRKKPVQYKDLSDEEIDKDERLSLSSSRKSISSLLDSSNNISARSEKSWILEHIKPSKPEPKTYKSQHKQEQCHTSQTDSSEEDNRSIVSRSMSGRSGILSLDLLSPSMPSLYREYKRKEEESNLILTPVTPLKLSNNQYKAEDDIEVYQTQENCTVSLNLGEDDDNIGSQDDTHKKLKESLKQFLGDSGFASDVVECESESDEDSAVEVEKSVLVPKKLFKFDHSSILETVKGQSDAGSTCSDLLDDQQEMDYPVHSGLSSFITAFGADIQKHLNAKKKRFEEVTKKVLKSTQKQFSSTWLEQQQYQTNVTDDFQAKMMAELAQLEADIVKMKNMELKFEEFFRGQLEMLHSSFISQKTRLDNFKKMHSSYKDRTKKVQSYNSATQKNMIDQLRKEMVNLQKKLIEETQKQELMNVRRGLQNLF